MFVPKEYSAFNVGILVFFRHSSRNLLRPLTPSVLRANVGNGAEITAPFLWPLRFGHQSWSPCFPKSTDWKLSDCWKSDFNERTLLILKSSFVRSQKNPKDEFICYSKCSVGFSWQLVDCTRLSKWLSFMCASHPREVYMPWLLILNGRFSGIGTHSSYSRPRVLSDYRKPSYLVHVTFLHTSSLAQICRRPICNDVPI